MSFLESATLIIIVIFLTITRASVIITEDEDELFGLSVHAGQIFASVPLFYGQGPDYQRINVSGTLINENQSLTLNDLSGYIILFSNSNSIYEPNFRIIQNRGASAIVTGYEQVFVPGQIMYILDGSGISDITIPIVQIKSMDFSTLNSFLKNRKYLNVTVSFSETNPWKALNEGGYMIFFSVIVGAPSLVLIIECIRRLYLIVKYNNNTKNKLVVPVSCLVLLIISSIFRIILCIDPMRSFRIFTSAQASVFICCPHWLLLMPEILLAFCLHDIVVSKKIKVNIFLGKLRIPFLIALILVILFGFVVLGLISSRRVPPGSNFQNILIAVVFIVNLFVAVYFGYAAHKILTAMKKSSKYSKNLMQASVKLSVVTGGTILITIIGMFIVVSLQLSPIAYNTIFLLIFFIDVIITAAIASFFETPGDRSSSSSAASNKSNTASRTAEATAKTRNDNEDDNNNNNKTKNNNNNKTEEVVMKSSKKNNNKKSEAENKKSEEELELKSSKKKNNNKKSESSEEEKKTTEEESSKSSSKEEEEQVDDSS